MNIDTKQKILRAARSLFVADGFAGTSMAKIAKKAKVNHSLLFHHYTNKQQLWIAVKQSIVEEANKQQITPPSTDLPFKTFLSHLARNQLAFYRNNPDILRMIGWQRLENKEFGSLSSIRSAESQAWLDAFQSYQDQGDINKKIPVRYAVSYVLALIAHVGLDQAPFIHDDKDADQFVKFCIKQIASSF